MVLSSPLAPESDVKPRWPRGSGDPSAHGLDDEPRAERRHRRVSLADRCLHFRRGTRRLYRLAFRRGAPRDPPAQLPSRSQLPCSTGRMHLLQRRTGMPWMLAGLLSSWPWTTRARQSLGAFSRPPISHEGPMRSCEGVADVEVSEVGKVKFPRTL